jgi:uncharacterized repeat protein (TIGR01451 family)
MRKTLALTACIILIAGSCCKAQYVNIPDTNLRIFLQYLYPACFNSSGQMDTTCSEIVNEDVVSLYADSSFEGLQYFKHLVSLGLQSFADPVDSGHPPAIIPALPATIQNLGIYGNFQDLSSLPPGLRSLSISNNFATQTLPPFPSTLESISFDHCFAIRSLPPLPNGLRTIDLDRCWGGLGLPSVLPDSLKRLKCYETGTGTITSMPEGLVFLSIRYTSLSSITAFPGTLDSIILAENELLTSLPELPASLRYLDCSGNALTSLPELPASLQNLYCNYNALTSLPALPPGLLFLGAGGNPLTSLPVFPNKLVEINLANYYSTSPSAPLQLPTLPDSLEVLYCAGIHLRTIPALPGKLRILDCPWNDITELPELPASLNELTCYYNNINCLPRLPNATYGTIYFDADGIKCIPNQSLYALIPIRDIAYHESLPVPPLCNPTNNVSHCEVFPVIAGHVFYDYNNNGVRDAGEIYGKPNVRIRSSDESYTYSDLSGFYNIGTNDLGTCTVTVTPPAFYDITPASATYTFSRFDTLVNNNFALQANTTIDSLTMSAIAVNWAARPGFSFPYFIRYENTGTTPLSPNIVFDYDETRLIYDSSSNALVNNNGSSLSLSTGNVLPGQQGNFTAYFRVNPSAIIGDTLSAHASITANAVALTSDLSVRIGGSFDPNDKQATPQLSPSQVANGNYIDYTIRFQNTGTDTAFNVVISDTLSSDLQWGTLQMTASSHNCKVTIKDNIVFFEFLNILLPDSNINEPLSHGFVSFKIKPQTTVAVNTTIPNSAAIYFDYNAPVITNTAGTLIKEFTVIPLKLISFSAVPQNGNTTSLYWNTANEINTKHFVIERSNDGLRFSAVTNIFAKGKANNNYTASVADAITGMIFYRLKIIDTDGSFVYSPVVKIDKRKNTPGIHVLSNPVKDFIFISTADRSLNNTLVNIINMQGAVVKKFILKEGSQTVEVKNLPAGIYYLKTINGSSRILVR